MSAGEYQVSLLEECYRAGLTAFVEYAKANWQITEKDKEIENSGEFAKGWNAALDGLGGCLDSFFEEYQY